MYMDVARFAISFNWIVNEKRRIKDGKTLFNGNRR